tara:strand:- start:120 stop:818 length:699 start_codon:yes stop_codon:yes gene_type:complete
MDPSNPVLVLFCKEPRLGYGKQRLAASIGKRPALRIAHALVDCALEDAARWEGTFVISPASDEETAWAKALSDRSVFGGRHTRIVAQTGGNLGSRIVAVDSSLRGLGATQIIYMGCDAPLLNNTHYEAVMHTLKNVDVVLADGADGGVTLMASRSGWPPLDELPWSTSELGNALTNSCAASGRSVHRLDGGFDIDEKRDALRLLEYLDGDMRPARQALNTVLIEEVCTSIPA